ncbi:MAG: sulfite reductase flavoprotein subunit alpha [Hyphomicrobiaceae bacterium]
MTALLPKTAPFAPEQIDTLNTVVGSSTPMQRSWLAGFLAGVEAAGGQAAQPAAAARPRIPLTLLYGSESGNAEGLALKARKLAQRHGFDARVLDMADADPATLAKAQNLVVFVATWGEGDPPQRATDFYTKLMADGAPRLEGVKFAVLSLGDTAYANFCSVGQTIDARLEALGAQRAADRVDLDLDFAKKAADWTERALTTLAPSAEPDAPTVVHVDFRGGLALDEPVFTPETPLEAEITAAVNLNGTGSSSETWHIELATDAPGYSYEPGDAIGVIPENDAGLAAELASVVGLGGNADLVAKLTKSHDITTLTRPVVVAYAKLTGRSDVASLEETEAFKSFAADRQLVDLLAEFPESLTEDQLLGLLRPLPPRLYSVASSAKAHAGETHLLVSAVRWQSHGRRRQGVTSTWLADRRKPGDRVSVYVKRNRHFRLPKDPTRPIIMIGAGTGVAPYRAFVEERAETGVTSPSWLFFGARNYTNDFLYQLEWQEHLQSRALGQIDVAFSRDQPEKIYVQDRLWAQREEIRNWIADGAHVYLCGDEKGLGRDVDATLARILAEPKNETIEGGKAQLAELLRAGRYQRDVY